MRTPIENGFATIATPIVVQHREGVAGAVADRQHHVRGGDRLAVGERDAGDAAAAVGCAFDLEPLDAGAEAIAAAERFDLGADALDHRHQPECADVRLGLPQDLFGRTGGDELGQYLAALVARILDLAVELAVGKGAGAALAELDIGFGAKDAAPPQRPGVLGALAYDGAAFEYDRPEATLGEDQRRQQAAGTGADHHRPQGFVAARQRRRPIAEVGRRLDVVVVGEAGEHGRFVADLRVDGVDERDRRALAGIGAAPEHVEANEVAGCDPEARHQCRRQCLWWVVERQFQFGDADHDRGAGLEVGRGRAQLARSPADRHHGAELRSGAAAIARDRCLWSYFSAASAWPKPASEIGMPMPASCVWKMMKIAFLPVFSCSTSLSSATTWA